MRNDVAEVTLGQLCELVQALNTRLIESEKVLEARFARLENGVGPNHDAGVNNGAERPDDRLCLFFASLTFTAPPKTLS